MKSVRQINSKFLLISALFGFFSTFAFQNCSGNKFGTADMNKVDESSTIEAGRSRTISLASKYNSQMNSQPIKVALIVDNSTTMLNSQTNLARNLSSLFSEISNYDAEVVILSTSWKSYKDVKNESERINSTTTRNISRTNFKSQYAPVIKISKNASADEKNLKYKSIGDEVKRLGTGGDDQEAALNTIAFALQGMTDFFSDDSRLLIYLITDENNQSMAEYVPKYFETMVRQLPAGPVQRSFVTASYTTFFVTRLVERPIYQDGVLIGTDTVEETKPAASVADCNAKNSPPSSVCNIENVVGMHTQATPNWCDVYRAMPGYSISSCVITYETTQESQSETTTVKDEPLFFMTREQHNAIAANSEANKAIRRQVLHQGLSDMLERKFKENYLFAVQANIEGQACTMGQGQSYDASLREFSGFLPTGQFMISSICDSAATSGQSLKKISERLDTIISKSYRLAKAQNEVIRDVRVVISGVKTRLNESQYILENGFLTILDSNLVEFQTLEVDLQSI